MFIQPLQRQEFECGLVFDGDDTLRLFYTRRGGTYLSDKWGTIQRLGRTSALDNQIGIIELKQKSPTSCGSCMFEFNNKGNLPQEDGLNLFFPQSGFSPGKTEIFLLLPFMAIVAPGASRPPGSNRIHRAASHRKSQVHPIWRQRPDNSGRIRWSG